MNNMPNFIIGGAPRSGTTYLASILNQHPNIYISKPFIPEPKVCLLDLSNNLDEYKKKYYDLYKDAPKNKLLGEKTSYYFENVEALNILKKICFNTKFIFILREPVARAYSNYAWSLKNGIETLSFEEAIKLEEKRDDPFFPEKKYVRPFDYLSRGNYFKYAKNYIDAFGKDQVLFIIFENLISDFEKNVSLIWKFLNIEDCYVDPKDFVKTNITNSSLDKIDHKLLLSLRKRMEPIVKSFASLTGLNIEKWGY